jgi:hypothetical protein
MVTIEQGDGQFQGTGGATQTQNPQALAPTSLQPNGAQSSNLQTVITSPSLFSNPQSSAVITVSGSSSSSVESLLASEAAPRENQGVTAAQTNAFFGVIAFLILLGAFFIIRNFTSEK